MAGLGRKVFTRERATVADVQGYLMDQTVMVFASASARNANITAPSDGMVTYLSDVDVYSERVNGVWRDRPSSNAGTSGVLAGTAPPAGAHLRTKTMYGAVVFNANGDGTLLYPGGSFSGVVAVTAIHVSQGGAPSNDLGFVPWNVAVGSCNLRCYSPSGTVFGGTGVACSVTIVGW